ncbi:MAG TPA: hypothetical protein VFO89_08760, partial [Thermoanaerobaculia bacterium]|nr:hypothetical protein [Thermoanaerobaculia bacterium]
AELLLMQARSGNPLIKNAFEQFYGMPDEQVDVSGLRLYWNSLWHHKTDIALSGGITVSMLARRPPPVTAPHARYGPRIDLVNPAPAGSRRVTVAGIPANATYAQRTYGPAFDAYGRFSGLTVEDVTARLRAGRLTPADLRVDFIVREGNTLILNTRTAQALEQAGIPRSQWVGVNRTGVPQYEDMLTEQLRRNNLTPAGTPAVRPAQRPQ